VADVSNSEVAHLAEDGAELWRDSSLTGPLSVNPTDGSCWVLDTLSYEVIHLAADGTQLWRAAMSDKPESVSVNSTDGSCWVVGGTEVVHLAENGSELWRGGGFDFEWFGDVSVNPANGSCWLIHVRGQDGSYGLELVHLSEAGAELWSREADFGLPGSLSASPLDGSCWVPGREALVNIAEDGSELLRVTTDGVSSISVNSTDGSLWVAEWSLDGEEWTAQVVHLAADGTELWRGNDPSKPWSVSVNPADGSCWVAARDFQAGLAEVVHLAENGTVLSRFASVDYPSSVSVNPVDGSCWVAASSDVVHLAEDGTELWRGGGFSYPLDLAVDPTDGSCWVADSDNTEIVHLAEDGTEVWRGGSLDYPQSVSVNPVDGSCWLAEGRHVVHVAEDGTELWRGSFAGAGGISVNPMDGSCWVAVGNNGQVVRLEVVGYEGPRFPDIMPYHWAFDEVEACVTAGIVAGYLDGLYHPERSVTRGQMAVFVARGLAGGDEGVPDFTGTPTFPDVDAEHWALDYVEYVVSQNVVGGYEDGTYHPEYQVTRGQMSVYVARSMVAPTTSVLADYVPADPRNFPDVLADHWAYTYVEYCVEHGVVGGYLDGTYRPTVVVTRDQMAVYVARAFGLPS
jgi:DNA-binding beta-propeller fold protein YncE